MMVALFVVVLVWLLLISLALVGHNARQAELQHSLKSLRRTYAEFGESSGSLASSNGLGTGTIVLLVSNTCLGCDSAIENALRCLESGLPTPLERLIVLTPNEDDARVRPPLTRLTDDQLYRQLYPGAAPALVVVADDGEFHHLDQGETLAEFTHALKAAALHCRGRARRDLAQSNNPGDNSWNKTP